MANIKSQIKRIKTNEKARQRNKSVKSSVKTAIRKFREAAEAGEKDKAIELIARRRPKARQGGQQGRDPRQPGGEQEVRHGEARQPDLSRLPVPAVHSGRPARPSPGLALSATVSVGADR